MNSGLITITPSSQHSAGMDLRWIRTLLSITWAIAALVFPLETFAPAVRAEDIPATKLNVLVASSPGEFKGTRGMDTPPAHPSNCSPQHLDSLQEQILASKKTIDEQTERLRSQNFSAERRARICSNIERLIGKIKANKDQLKACGLEVGGEPPAVPSACSGQSGPASKSAGGGSASGGGKGEADGGAKNGGGSTPPNRPIGGKAPIQTLLLSQVESTRPPGVPFPKGLPTLVAGDLASLKQLGKSWLRAERPQVSMDYGRGVDPMPKPVQVPDGASDLARAGLAAVDARQREIAYLDAYAESYARYRGAEQKRDQSAMARQAEAMVRFIEQALAEARSSARGQAEAERLLLVELERKQSALMAQGKGWSGALPPVVHWNSNSEMPAEIREEFAASRLPPDDITAFRMQMREIKPEAIDREIADLKGRLPADGGVSTSAPEASDILNLERAVRTALALRTKAQGTPAEKR